MEEKQFEFEAVSIKPKMKSAIEAMLFVSGEPLPAKDLINNLEIDNKLVLEIINEMTIEYEKEDRGLRLIEINGGYQLVTKEENSDFIQKLLKKNRKHSLSQASIESLAIIAYKQPITRIDIDEIRGVKSESAIQKLIEKNLIKESGRLDVPGRPILYSTTDEFLRQFGLETLKELPSLDLYSDEEAKSSMDVLNQALKDMNSEDVNDEIKFENNESNVDDVEVASDEEL